MGLFDWLIGNKQSQPTNRIWLTKNAKYQGMANEIAEFLADLDHPSALFVVAHFPDCLDELEALVATRRFYDDRLYITLAEDLPKVSRRVGDGSGDALLIVGEKHPLRSHDDQILDCARSLNGGFEVIFHVSLEDTIMRRFAGEWVIGTLRQLGMKEDEMIQNPMVSRQLSQAQDKIARRAFGDSRAKSAEEWFQANFPVN